MLTETWVPVRGYEGLYSVSDMGRVRSEERIIGGPNGQRRRWPQRILKLAHRPKKRGSKNRGTRYATVGLSRNGIQTTIRVHALVAEHFIEPRPDGMSVLHRDDDPNNNRVDNLRYGTSAENGRDVQRNNKTCRAGHERTEANAYIRPDTGQRMCLACMKIQNDKRPRKTGQHRNRKTTLPQHQKAA